jgi:D-sedoheptulose 7-phosphate isomerase
MRELGDVVREQLRASAEVKARTAETCTVDIVRAVELIGDALASGGKLLLCGNGGSAADCQHMATEFVSRLSMDFSRPAIPAIALTTDTSFLTAYTNDIDFDGVFARQVEALGRPGDVLIGISTSGRSKNVVRAAELARSRGIRVVILMGSTGVLADLADVAIRVPSQSTQHVQESHLAIEHVICYLVERRLFPPGTTAS